MLCKCSSHRVGSNVDDVVEADECPLRAEMLLCPLAIQSSQDSMSALLVSEAMSMSMVDSSLLFIPFHPYFLNLQCSEAVMASLPVLPPPLPWANLDAPSDVPQEPSSRANDNESDDGDEEYETVDLGTVGLEVGSRIEVR